MKLLYFTTASNQSNYEKIQQNSRIKASVATQVFESALLEGMASDAEIELTLYSFPMIAAFPGSRLLLWGARKEKVAGNFQTKWLPSVNLYGLKQFTQRLSARKAVRKWLQQNQNEKDKAILLYAVYEPIAAPVLKYAKIYGCPVFVIVPDLPSDMYKVLSRNPIKAAMQKRSMKRAVACQGQFDGYIYLTQTMSEVVAPEKPHMVMEGIADVSSARNPELFEKTKKRAIMYAGAISEKYGLKNLIEAFLMFNAPDTELWIFGTGDYASQVNKLAAAHENIIYFGRVSREEVLQYERKASLLVNVRNPKDEFTKYSFPSKTIEYMLSGTPLLTTWLSGIPEAYRPYVYTIEDNAPETICHAFRKVFQTEPAALLQMGKLAQQFIVSEKNATTQAGNILSFMRHELNRYKAK